MASTLIVTPASDWAQLVFHVLAHLKPQTNMPASLYDAHYVRWCEQHLEPAQLRTLAADTEALSQLCPTHAQLARLSLMPLLFSSIAQAERCHAAELSELKASEVDSAELLASLRVHDASELLRCAALLECSTWERLPQFAPGSALEERLQELAPLTPTLANMQVHTVPALRLRGRVMQRKIWIGLPNDVFGPSVEHVCWQAVHEATVLEVSDVSRELQTPLAHEALEQTSLCLLAERVRGSDWATHHQAWLRHFAALPAMARTALNAASRAILEHVDAR